MTTPDIGRASHYAHCMSFSGLACSCLKGRYETAVALDPADRTAAAVFANANGKAFLAYAAGQPYGAALLADVNARVERCRTYWNTKP